MDKVLDFRGLACTVCRICSVVCAHVFFVCNLAHFRKNFQLCMQLEMLQSSTACIDLFKSKFHEVL